MLTAETAIIARLQAQLPVTVPPIRVSSSAAVAGTVDIATLCPLVLVHPGPGNEAGQSFDDGIVEEQTWRVVLVVKNIPDRNLAATYQAAGQVLSQIVVALDGFRELGEGYEALKYTGRADPDVAVGFSEFTLEFKTTYTLSTVPAEPSPDAFITFDAQYDLDTAQAGEPVAEDNVTLPQ